MNNKLVLCFSLAIGIIFFSCKKTDREMLPKIPSQITYEFTSNQPATFFVNYISPHNCAETLTYSGTHFTHTIQMLSNNTNTFASIGFYTLSSGVQTGTATISADGLKKEVKQYSISGTQIAGASWSF